MKLKIIIVGIILILFSAPGYQLSPSLITQQMNSLTGGAKSVSTDTLLAQMGIPSIDTISKITQYSFVGMAVAGLGIIVFGVFSKKIPKQPLFKSTESSDQKLENEEDLDLKALRYLQEGVTKGEITSDQYQNLKSLLEKEKVKTKK